MSEVLSLAQRRALFTLNKSSISLQTVFRLNHPRSRSSPSRSYATFKASPHTSPEAVHPLPATPPRRVLETLPLPVLIRSIIVLAFASLPSTVLSRFITTTKKHSARITSSPLLRRLLERTFYDAFCIGSTKAEIETNVNNLRRMGIDGVVLAFAREATASQATTDTRLTRDEPQLRDWVSCNLETVDKLQSGDYLAIRCTGAGKPTLKVMEDFSRTAQTVSLEKAVDVSGPQLDVFRDAMFEICSSAKEKDVRVLIDAEDVKHQSAIDHVGLDIMSKFNRNGRSIVFNTYQMYLKSGLTKLQAHLEFSTKNDFNLGIKMVRGAYLHTEPDRTLLQDTKKATDASYDAAVSFLINPSAGERKWSADVMLATHNSNSAWKALSLYSDSIKTRAASVEGGVRSLAFAQLMGMADEVSLKLVSEIKKLESTPTSAGLGKYGSFPQVGVYKYSVWGSLEECLLYMLRRAEENKDAVARSRETARAMILELFKRMLPFSFR